MTFGDTDPSTPAQWIINATSSLANDGANFINLATASNPTINVLGANQTVTINANLSNSNAPSTSWGLAKGGPGTLVLTGYSSGLSGIIFINNGTLTEDFNHPWAPVQNIIGDSSGGSSGDSHLELQGGTLNLIGQTGTSSSQTFTAGTNAGISASSITMNQNGSTSLSLKLKRAHTWNAR